MDERKLRILRAIIDDYILTAVPVGSRTISRKYETSLSSATIRNEMSDLEELGYLDQPHVSAGRIPSAKAYRLYVDQLLASGAIRSDTEESIRHYFSSHLRQMERVIDEAAKALSSLTGYTAVVLEPGGHEPRIRNIQLVSVSSRSALVVIVTDAGLIRDHVVSVPRGVDPDTLYMISQALTEALMGCTPSEACDRIPILTARMEQNTDLLRSVGGLMTEARDKGSHGHIGIGGVSNMLSYPEYSDMEKARNFLSLVETRDRLAQIIRQRGDVAFTVRIGPETGVPEISDCSVVTATYTTSNGRQGTIGVIGPTRMQYSRVLSVLAGMGQQLSQLFDQQEDSNSTKGGGARE